MAWHEHRTRYKHGKDSLPTEVTVKQYLTKTHGKHQGLNAQSNNKTRDTCEQ